MQTSIFLARLLAPVLVILGASLVMHRTLYTAMANEFIASPAMLFLAGAIALTGGVAMVLVHNVWVADWRVIITLLGWLMVLAGIVRLLLPEFVKRLGRDMLKSERPILFAGIGWIIIGAVLGYAGYTR